MYGGSSDLRCGWLRGHDQAIPYLVEVLVFVVPRYEQDRELCMLIGLQDSIVQYDL